MASLSLKDVCKVYPNGYKAVQNFNMEIADMTESAQINDSIQECREVIFENQTTRDFIEIAKRQVKDFGSATVRAVLGTLIEDICRK